MQNEFEITGLYNCGVMIKSRGSGVLVDGINTKFSCFNRLPDEVYQDMLASKEPFDNLEYLLFTHSHPDHFDDERCAGLIRVGQIKKVFLPCFGLRGVEKTLEAAAQRQTEIVSPDYSRVDSGETGLGDYRLRFFATGHLGVENNGIPHYSLLVESDEHACYFSSDSDYMREREIPLLQGIPIDFAFYNPYYLNTLNGRRIITALGAKQNIIYHLPFENNDPFGIRKLALKDAQKYSEQVGGVKLLLEPMLGLS